MDDLGAVDQHVLDTIGLGHDPARPARQVIAGAFLARPDAGGIEDDDDGVEPLGEFPALREAVQARWQVRELAQFRARTQLVEQDHPEAGHLRLIGNPVHTTVQRESVAPAPKRGEHTDEVLREIFGYDERRIATLRARTIVR